MFNEYASEEEIINALSPYHVGDIVISNIPMKDTDSIGVFEEDTVFTIETVEINYFVAVPRILKKDLNDYCVLGYRTFLYELKDTVSGKTLWCTEDTFRLNDTTQTSPMFVNVCNNITENSRNFLVTICVIALIVFIITIVLLLSLDGARKFLDFAIMVISIWVLALSAHLIDNVTAEDVFGIVNKNKVRRVYFVTREDTKNKYYRFKYDDVLGINKATREDIIKYIRENKSNIDIDSIVISIVSR